jgi:hypothetical protein
MSTSESRLLGITSSLLALLVFLGLTCKSQAPNGVNDPIQVTVRPDRSKGARTGDLCVTLKNRCNMDLLFQSDVLPWELNAGGVEFVLYREDGSVVNKTPMIADPIVGRPTLLKRGRQLSHPLSLLAYYTDLSEELAVHNLKVNWRYLPRPANLACTSILSGEFLLKTGAPSSEDN